VLRGAVNRRGFYSDSVSGELLPLSEKRASRRTTKYRRPIERRVPEFDVRRGVVDAMDGEATRGTL
jgi:hypothetical protein